MKKAQQLIVLISWALGLVSLLSGFAIKLLNLETRLTVAGRTGFILAGAFFLCALATRSIDRS